MERMTAKQYRQSQQGRINRAQGAHFEEAIEAACTYYDLRGEAFVEKTPEPMKILRPINRQRGTFEAVFAKTAQPDFKGTMRGSQAVCFDAKHTTRDRIEQSAITQEQKEALDKHEALGAWCFVLVSLGNRFYRIPWHDWKDMKNHFGHKYMDAEDLAPYELEFTNGVIHFLGMVKGSREFLDRQFGKTTQA